MNSGEVVELTLNSGRSFSLFEAERLIYSVIEPTELDYNTYSYKHFFYEMQPLLWLSQRLKEADRVKFMGGLARYDGAVRFKKEKHFQKIEFTRAVDSEVQSTKSTLRKMGFDFDISEIYTKEQSLENMLLLWDEAFTKKSEKNARTLQYQGVWLAIVFDDESFEFPNDKSTINGMATWFIKSKRRQINKVFRRVFIISLSGEYIYDSDNSLI